MKRRKFFILIGSLCLVLIVAALPFMAACAKPAPTLTPAPTSTPAPAPTPTPTPAPTKAPTAKPITLDVTCFSALTTNNAYFVKIFVNRINERAKGELTLKLLGGPEVIPALQQHEAVRRGVVDICLTSPTFYEASLKEAGILNILGMTFPEERTSGFNAFFDQIHNRDMNAHYLGRATWFSGYFLWSKKLVDKLADMKGLRIRMMGTHEPIIRAVEGVPVGVETAEAYSALERGVVDMIAMEIGGIYTNKIYEVTKYRVGPPFFQTGLCMIMNLDSWNKLPKNLQSLITDVMVEFETEVPAYWGKEEQVLMQKMLDAGVKIIELSPEETKKVSDLSYSKAWELMKPKVSPESYAKMSELAKRQ